jgi:hypothetical protein
VPLATCARWAWRCPDLLSTTAVIATINADRWADELRLSDIELRFDASAQGHSPQSVFLARRVVQRVLCSAVTTLSLRFSSSPSWQASVQSETTVVQLRRFQASRAALSGG